MSSAALTAESVAPSPIPMSRGKLAMWLFLGTEVMFFAGLMGSYIVLRISDPIAFSPEFLEAQYHAALNIPMATVNTIVLICSSLTMLLAVNAAKEKNDAKVRKFLFLTVFLGLVFCGIKGVEYSQKFSHGIDPSTAIFYSCYFVITGVHLVHVIGGMVPMLVMGFMGGGRWTKEGNNTIEIMGLYWHFVDVVWIFLFPMLYLLK